MVHDTLWVSGGRGSRVLTGGETEKTVKGIHFTTGEGQTGTAHPPWLSRALRFFDFTRVRLTLTGMPSHRPFRTGGRVKHRSSKKSQEGRGKITLETKIKKGAFGDAIQIGRCAIYQ